MSKVTKIIIGLIILIIVIGGIWYGTTRKSKEEEVIKIGAIIPLTGVAAQYGENEDKAIKLALEEINSMGGVLGKKIEIIYEDTKCDGEKGATAMNKLINVDKVDLVISFECSAPTLSAAPIAENNKKLFVVAVATAPGIAQQGRYIFRITPPDTAQGKDLAGVIKSRGYQRVAVLYLNNDYGVGIKDIFKNNFEGDGRTMVASETFTEEASDFKTQLTKIKGKAPEALLLVAYANQYAQLFKQIKELDIKAQIFASETLKDETLMKKIGNIADSTIVTYYSSPLTEERNNFVEKMKERYGEEPGTYADFAYDAVWIVKEAITKANKLDTETIKQSLESISYNGVTGLTEFDEYGEVKGKTFVLYIIKNGKFVPLEDF